MAEVTPSSAKILLALIVIGGTNLGCQQPPTSGVQGRASQGGGGIALLGLGFDSDLDSAKERVCVTGEPRFEGAATTEAEYHYSQSADDLLQEASGSGKARVDLGPISGKAKLQYLLRAAETKQSLSMIYDYSYRRGAMKLWNKTPASDLNLENLGDVELRGDCGDQFIDQVVLGAQLFISLKITFREVEFKEQLKGKARIKFLGRKKDFKKTFIDRKDEFTKVSVSIEAFQIGGNPEGLEAVVKPFKKAERSRQIRDRRNKVICDLRSEDGLKGCLDLHEAIMKYVKSDFAKQIDRMQNPQSEMLGALQIMPKDYRAAGLPGLDPASRPASASYSQLLKRLQENQSAVSDLNGAADANAAVLANVESLLDARADLDKEDPTLTDLSALLALLDEREVVIEEERGRCQTNLESQCLKTVDLARTYTTLWRQIEALVQKLNL